MVILTHFITLSFAVAEQLSAEDMANVAAQGFKTMINSRPYGGGGSTQPPPAEIERSARALGLNYIYLPVISGAITQALVMREALPSAPTPVLALYRPGARSSRLYGLVQNA